MFKFKIHEKSPTAFNSHGIVYDNSPWRPAEGRDLEFTNVGAGSSNGGDLVAEPRVRHNVATRIMSNGVGVIVANDQGKSAGSIEAAKGTQSIFSFFNAPVTLAPSAVRSNTRLTVGQIDQNRKSTLQPVPKIISSENKTIINSSIVTLMNHQLQTASHHHLLKHNYIIKTCLTTYTYLTTFMHNKRSSVSTYETVVSVISTESLKNYIDVTSTVRITPTRTKYFDLKTPSPTQENLHTKIEKRIDAENETTDDLIQPSEVSPATCSLANCPCPLSKTESLNENKHKTKYNDNKNKYEQSVPVQLKRSPLKTNKYGAAIVDSPPTPVQDFNKKTRYGPYKYDSDITPSDKVVEKYTEVINDSPEESGDELGELLTNEQGPGEKKTVNKVTESKKPDKIKDKPQKINKNKFPVADLLKLGTLGIKSLSQLAPVFEKMTGNFIKRHEETKVTTTVKPVTKLTPYIVDKRIDSEKKPNNFPIYIPVDDIETSESQLSYHNTTLHQNLAWAADHHKHPKAHLGHLKSVHESALVNGGIPISPGEIITTNSDVIVGKPAVGNGPLSHLNRPVHNHNVPPHDLIDSYAEGNTHYDVREKPPRGQHYSNNKRVPLRNDDDSYDLRPPFMEPHKTRPPQIDGNFQRNPFPKPRPTSNNSPSHTNTSPAMNNPSREQIRHEGQPKYPNPMITPNDRIPNHMSAPIHTSSSLLYNHGRPAFLDYIPSLGHQNNNEDNHINRKYQDEFNRNHNFSNSETSYKDNEHLPSEPIQETIVSSQIFEKEAHKPFLVDIQPSKVANVLIPHGSSTALIFAGSSEPHKTGDYVDDPLPYQEPGYFGSFSIDAPQMTMVHNVAPSPLNNHQFNINNNQQRPDTSQIKQNNRPQIKFPQDQSWNSNNRRPVLQGVDVSKLPPPTSQQETHMEIGPHIAAYNPEIFNPTSFDFEKKNPRINGLNQNSLKKTPIDREYENHLAVPPPPLSMLHGNQQQKTNSQGSAFSGLSYNQHPVFHTKPIQDMKVFVNIEHPVPNPTRNDPGNPSKVTSEIYFASPTPQNQDRVKPFTVHLPSSPKPVNFNQNPQDHNIQNVNSKQRNNTQKYENDVAQHQFGPQTVDVQQHTGINMDYRPNEHNIRFEQPHVSVSQTNFKVPEEGGSIVLNTGANFGESHILGHKVTGTSITIPTQQNAIVQKGESTGIPIGTNVAIKVEGVSNNYGQNVQAPPQFYDGQQENPEIIIGGNNWQAGPIGDTFYGNQDNYNFPEVRKNDTVAYTQKENDGVNNGVPQKNANSNSEHSPVSFMNSHANFPMTRDEVPTPTISPAHHIVENYHENDYNQPPKRTPNYIKGTSNQNVYQDQPPVATNINFPKINTGAKKIKIESTTHNIIPLSYQYESKNASDKIKFGQKLPTIGLPPTKFNWIQHSKPATNVQQGSQFKPNIDTINEFMAPPPLTTPSYNLSYIPNYGSDRQPAYDIPMREDPNDDQPTKPTQNSNEVKPVYENYDEIYDGENGGEDFDGEVSEESMKVPVITTTRNDTLDDNVSDSTGTSKRKVVVSDSSSDYNPSPGKEIPHNIDTQTEKPFGQGNFNPVLPQSDSNKHDAGNTFLLGSGQMHPRPFEVSENSKPLSQGSGHWTSNQVNINTTPDVKDENTNLVLNTGEEVIGPLTRRPITFTTEIPAYTTTVDSLKIKHRPVFSLKYNNTNRNNGSKIITSTINLASQNSITVFNSSIEEDADNSYSVEDTDMRNDAVTEIENLSPPPPTLDYNFNPSNNGETIMGMSPPPPKTASRIPPVRISPPRTAPPRTPPTETVPSRPPPSRTLPPRLPLDNSNKNEISTYRPTYDIIKNKPFQRPGFSREPKPRPSFVAPSTIENSIIFSELSESKVIFPTPIIISSGWMTSSGIGFPSLGVPGTSVDPVEENVSEIMTHVHEETPMSNKPLEPSIAVIPLGETSLVSIINSAPIDTDEEVTVAQSSTNIDIKPSDIRPNSVLEFPEIEPTSILSKPVSKYSTIRIPPSVYRPILIEGSEKVSNHDEVNAKPTEVLKSDQITKLDNTASKPERTATVVIKPRPNTHFNRPSVRPINNKEIVRNSPGSITTKTEIKTEAVTLTKTLAEPPSTVSTTRFVTLTHTLTVTQIETSLLSPLPGSTTQTLILTNTQTSTLVDVVTEIHTQVQPTTIVETVTKHIPVVTSYEVHPTRVENVAKTKIPALDDISLSSEEDNFIIRTETTNTTEKNVQKLDKEKDNDSFFVVMNKAQNGGSSTPVRVDMEPEFNGPTRDEGSGHDGVLLGEILIAGTPYLESTNVASPTGPGYGKDCQPDCKASRNERCQRMDGIMKCVCRPGFARMFPDRPCKPTYTYSMKLALSRYGKDKLAYQDNLSQPSSKEFQNLALATHEGINRMVMQSDLRDVYHGVHINGFEPVTIPKSDKDPKNTGVINDFYVQLSDNAHETRLKEVIEKYLRTNNYSLGGTDVYAASELVDKLAVSDYNECLSSQFHDCSEHAECFNLRGTYTCSCKEGFADLSVNPLYPGRICSAEPVGCERCNYHGACYTRDDDRVICECFQWYAGASCQVNLKVILISLATLGAILLLLLVLCVCVACARRRPEHDPAPPAPLAACIQGLPTIHQGGAPSKRRGAHDRRALIAERSGGNDSGGESGSVHNASLPYIPAKKISQASHTSHKSGRKTSVQSDEAGDRRQLTLMIPRARYHPAPPTSPLQGDNGGRKNSSEMSNEAKLISYLDGGPGSNDDQMRRKHSNESGYSMNKMHQGHSKHPTGALISAGFKVSTTIKPDLESIIKEGSNDDASSIHKDYLDTTDMSHFDTLRPAYSQDDMTEWTDAERRIGELTMSEARSFNGTLVKPPTKLISRSTCGSNKSSARYTQHEANTMAERDLGSTFLLPHVHLYKPDLGSDMSEFDSL